jgi:hypothetical protein
LKLTRRLDAAGFPTQQAGDMAEALSQLATKADLAAIRTEIVAGVIAGSPSLSVLDIDNVLGEDHLLAADPGGIVG